jgi:uncharacterized membrane protein (DUF485 family)
MLPRFTNEPGINVEIVNGGMTMLHEPAAVHAQDEAAAYKRRLGLKMLAVYGAIYIIFMIVNVAWPKAMGWIVVAGLNVAIVWGFFLIVLALVLALIYNAACTRHEKSFEREGQA